MNGNFDTGLFLIWLVSGVLMMTGAAIAFIWAWRSGQFRDRDRARYLALWSGIPEDGAENDESRESSTKRKGDTPHV